MFNVLQVVDYYPFYGGRVVHEIVKRLSGNLVAVKVASSNLMFGSSNCDNVIRLSARHISVRHTPYVIYDVRDLGLLNRQLDVDIIHLHFLYSFLALYIGLKKKIDNIKAPIVATSHGLTSGYSSRVVRATAMLLNKLAKNFVIANASAITTVSKIEHNFLERYIPSEKLYYIPNGVDTSFFKPDEGKRRELRHKLGIETNEVLVLYFASLRATKGIFTFLKAMAQVTKKKDSVKFIVAGSGPLTNYVEEVKGKIGNSIHTFLGYVSDEALPYLYNASDVYVLPSYVEGMPLSVMESMACGKPVIVTSVGDVPILVKNDVNGIVIPPDNADLLAESIIFLAENPKLRNLMGEANIRKTKQYDWDKIVPQYYKLYLRTLNA